MPDSPRYTNRWGTDPRLGLIASEYTFNHEEQYESYPERSPVARETVYFACTT